MSQSHNDVAAQLPLKRADAGARRLRLREFQVQLVERMEAARTGAQAKTSQLGVMIGPDRCLLDLQQAGEIVSVGSITAVPLTRPWFLGLTNLRGNLISVVDLAQLQGHPPTVIDKDCRIIAFGPSLAFNSALLVSRVLGLRNVAEMTVQEDPADSVLPAWAAHGYVDRDARPWRALDLAAIIQDVQFLQVGS
ncbi:twitching motility protein PilI [Actimicrobium sp. GrIS 1.19]|uniref:chemotaxis protein CheW n=1 Tax=Actimicrobium sp. GrIS 1.19 TaxID=3071708 RepID=UPI002DFF0A1C|nr:twitching motility protein PilI [Actimicrobium sp. GrIS 1.19]